MKLTDEQRDTLRHAMAEAHPAYTDQEHDRATSRIISDISSVSEPTPDYPIAPRWTIPSIALISGLTIGALAGGWHPLVALAGLAVLILVCAIIIRHTTI